MAVPFQRQMGVCVNLFAGIRASHSAFLCDAMANKCHSQKNYMKYRGQSLPQNSAKLLLEPLPISRGGDITRSDYAVETADSPISPVAC
jgi:hypothetical protein